MARNLVVCKCTKAVFVTVYADFNTPEGKAARDFFFDRAIAFDEIDVSADENGRREMFRLSGQDTRPVVVVNDEVVVGFDAGALETLLA